MRKLTLCNWRLALVIITIISVASFAMVEVTSASAGTRSNKTVKVWIQVTDSCKQALSGATFTVTGPDINRTTAPTIGTIPQGLPGYVNGQCPIQQGTCVEFPTGCTSTILNVPVSGTAIYKITVAKTAPGYGTNLSYAICDGGSDCPHGSEVATVKVESLGSVSATVFNPYPSGASAVWPLNKSAYSGSQSDPILFHEYGIGNGSIQCDGDHDADDYLTGTPNHYCNSDNDR